MDKFAKINFAKICSVKCSALKVYISEVVVVFNYFSVQNFNSFPNLFKIDGLTSEILF